MKGIEGQISLFDIIEQPREEMPLPLPCETCGYDAQGCCDYPCTPDDYCVLGNKWIPNVMPGDWVEEDLLGDRLTFEEITQEVGNLIIIDKSTQSHAWYKVVLVEKIITHGNDTRSLFYYDGVKQRGMIGEQYFEEGHYQYTAKAWRIKR